jgi:hypothetical protein
LRSEIEHEDEVAMARRHAVPLARRPGGRKRAGPPRRAVALALASALGAAACSRDAAPQKAPAFIQRLACIEQAEARGVVVTREGTTVVAIEYHGTVRLDEQALPSRCAMLPAPSRDLLLIGMDPKGAIAWHRELPCLEGSSIDAAPAGGLVLVGAIRAPLDLGTGTLGSSEGRDVVVASIDSTGATRWAKAFPAPGDQRVSAVAVGGDGRIALAGGFEHAVDLGGGALRGAEGARRSLFFGALDADGAHLWSRAVGADLWQGPSVASDAKGEIVLGASLRSGGVDLGAGRVGLTGGVLVGRFDAAGEPLWSKVFGSGNDAVHRVAIGPSGEVLVAGETASAIDFGGGPGGDGSDDASDPFVAKLDASGAFVWSRFFRAAYGVLPSAAQATALAVDPGGNVAFAGKILEGTVDLGDGPLRPDVGNFIGELDASGALRWGTWLSRRERSDPSHHHVAIDASGDVVVVGDVTRRPKRGGSIYGVFLARFKP